jgi:hypothetical protein
LEPTVINAAEGNKLLVLHHQAAARGRDSQAKHGRRTRGYISPKGGVRKKDNPWPEGTNTSCYCIGTCLTIQRGETVSLHDVENIRPIGGRSLPHRFCFYSQEYEDEFVMQ